jgi:hypothetical protein
LSPTPRGATMTKTGLASLFTIIACSLTLNSVAPVYAAADGVIGTWQGYIEGFPQGYEIRDIGGRVLEVKTVSNDGAVEAKWSQPGYDFGKPQARLANGTLYLDLFSKAKVSLRREGDKLVGTFTDQIGKEFPLTMMHQQLTANFDGEWHGLATGGTSCPLGEYQIAIKGGEVSGMVNFSAKDDVSVKHISEVGGAIWADGNIFLGLKPRDEKARDNWFHLRVQGGTLIGTDPALKKTGCTYQVLIARQDVDLQSVQASGLQVTSQSAPKGNDGMLHAVKNSKITVIYVGAADCGPCMTWQLGMDTAWKAVYPDYMSGPVWAKSPERQQVEFREIHTVTVAKTDGDEYWPTDLRWVRDATFVKTTAPRFIVIVDHQVVVNAIGADQWHNVAIPAIRRLIKERAAEQSATAP